MKLDPDLERKILELAGTPAPGPAPALSEKEFQAEVIALAKRRGWKVWHCFDSRKSGAGLPDLLLVRGRVCWAELKTAAGELAAAQLEWIDALRAAGQEVYVWRPADLPEIERVLADG